MNLLAAAPGQIDSGDTAIVLVSAGLVLLMTPGANVPDTAALL